MTDMLKSGEEWLSRMRAGHLATENALVYHRSDGGIVTLSDTVIASYRQQDASVLEGGLLGSERRDYIIPSSQLWSPPVEGEEIWETQGTKTYIFVVTGEFGESPWEWHDRVRSAYRVHTVYNREEPPC